LIIRVFDAGDDTRRPDADQTGLDVDAKGFRRCALVMEPTRKKGVRFFGTTAADSCLSDRLVRDGLLPPSAISVEPS